VASHCTYCTRISRYVLMRASLFAFANTVRTMRSASPRV